MVYLGRATEHANGGLCKRLKDYTRPEPGRRRYGAGPRLHAMREHVDVDVLVTAHDAKAAHAAEQLERYFIQDYPDGWNKVGRRREAGRDVE